VTIGETLLRMAIAMYAIGHWACLIVGVVLGVAAMSAWRRARDWFARRNDLDAELIALLRDEGCYYGNEPWDSSQWLDDAPREGGGR
jgi:hypothetical protein